MSGWRSGPFLARELPIENSWGLCVKRLRAHAIAAADRLAKHSGVFGLMRSRCAAGATILMYHKVLPKDLVAAYPLRSLCIDESTFHLQMAWLAKHYEVKTVRDSIQALEQGRGRPLACVTFDDGYRDNFEYAAPILELHGLRATFFVTSGFVEGTPLWFDRAACAWSHNPQAAILRAREVTPESDLLEGVTTLDTWMVRLKHLPRGVRNRIVSAVDTGLEQPDEVFGPLSPNQVRQLAAKGHEIASHSVTHPILTEIDDSGLRAELEKSRSALSGWAGQRIDGFCYPNGDCDARVAAAAQRAGYLYGCSVRRGLATRASDRMALPRRAVFSTDRPESVESFEGELVGWHDLLRSAGTRLRRVFRIAEGQQA